MLKRRFLEAYRAAYRSEPSGPRPIILEGSKLVVHDPSIAIPEAAKGKRTPTYVKFFRFFKFFFLSRTIAG